MRLLEGRPRRYRDWSQSQLKLTKPARLLRDGVMKQRVGA